MDPAAIHVPLKYIEYGFGYKNKIPYTPYSIYLRGTIGFGAEAHADAPTSPNLASSGKSLCAKSLSSICTHKGSMMPSYIQRCMRLVILAHYRPC